MDEPASGPAVFVVSGGDGSGAERMVRIALAQFPDADMPVVLKSYVRTAAEIEDATTRAAASQGLIVHTLVDPRLREEMYAIARRHHVVAIDLIGSLLTRLGDLVGRPPLGKPGLYRQLNEDYFRRVEAIEFTVQHDDGRRVEELGQAEIVLVGVSRVSKTPLSIYLSTRGWKVGNVPIILNVPLPPRLFELDPKRVVGLTVRPERLTAIRRLRAERLTGEIIGEYASPDIVALEMAYAHEQFRRGGWRILDMTHRSIEDAAAEVVALIA